jgi:hypothetical protein
MKQLVKAYNEFIADLYQSHGHTLKVWMRSHHRTGMIYAYQVGEKDQPIHCFAVFSDGKVVHDRHENLVGLFKDG